MTSTRSPESLALSPYSQRKKSSEAPIRRSKEKKSKRDSPKLDELHPLDQRGRIKRLDRRQSASRYEKEKEHARAAGVSRRSFAPAS